MDKVNKLLKKARVKLGDKQAVYFYGVEYSSDSVPDFRARIIPSKEGVTPLLIGGSSEEELIKQIEMYLEHGDVKPLAVQYCEHQIHVHEEAIKFNRQLIEDYAKLDEDTRSELPTE